MSEVIHYLGYGSNLHPSRLSVRISSAHLISTVCLQSCKLVFHKLSTDGSGNCTIKHSSNGNMVFGAIFTIHRHDKSRLDKLEGLGKGYEEVVFNLPPFGLVFCYVAESEAINENLHPYTWYKEFVLRGARYHSFPDSYIAAIESVDAVDDPDFARSKEKFNELKGWKDG